MICNCRLMRSGWFLPKWLFSHGNFAVARQWMEWKRPELSLLEWYLKDGPFQASHIHQPPTWSFQQLDGTAWIMLKRYPSAPPKSLDIKTVSSWPSGCFTKPDHCRAMLWTARSSLTLESEQFRSSELWLVQLEGTVQLEWLSYFVYLG